MSEADALPTLRTCSAFFIAAAAAASVSEWTRQALKLPLITGYILLGIVCGPSGVAMLGQSDCASLARLLVADAMGFIGLSAGSKFLLSELKGNVRTVLCVLTGQLLLIYPIVFSGMYFLSPYLELTAHASADEVLAISLLIACLAVARSPSSAIALVSELGASGPFTTVSLSTTVLIDIVVVFLFAITLLLVRQLLPKPGVEAVSSGVVLGTFALQISASVILGVLLGGLLHLVITATTATTEVVARTERSATEDVFSGRQPVAAAQPASAPEKPRPRLQRFNSLMSEATFGGARDTSRSVLGTVWDELLGLTPLTSAAERASAPYRRKAVLVGTLWLGVRLCIMLSEAAVLQIVGYEVFETELLEEKAFGRPFHQPLIITMCAGFIVVNFTTSRRPLLRILHDLSEPVYVCFFTLTGMTLPLEAVLPNLTGAVVLFLLRAFGIFAGSYAGGHLAGAPPAHTSKYWMTFIVQAGVTLGLAQRVQHIFEDSFGPALGLVITAEVVLNQLLGPVLFKAAIIAVGEANPAQLISSPHSSSRPKPRCGVVVSTAGDADAAALCARLRARKWPLARCDVQATAATQTSAPSSPVRLGASQPRLGAVAAARRADRLKTLQQDVLKTLQDPPLAARLQLLVTAAGSNANPAGIALTSPTHPADGADGAEEAEEADMATQLQLLWAVASVDSADALVLLLPSDADALRVVKVVAKSAPLLSRLQPRQIATPQLLVRLRDSSHFSIEGALRDALKAGVAADGSAAFELIVISDRAVVPNLLAEVMHPETHYTASAMDNTMPDE